MRADAPRQRLPGQARRRHGRQRVVVQAARNFDFPRDWQQVRIKKRQIDFAWGPTSDAHAASRRRASNSSSPPAAAAAPARCGRRPLAARIAAASDDVAHADDDRVVLRRSRAHPAFAVDGNTATAWRSDPRHRSRAVRSRVDFGEPREFGGLVLRWQRRDCPHRATTSSSRDDGGNGEPVRSVATGQGGLDRAAAAGCRDALRAPGVARGPGARIRARAKSRCATSRSAPRTMLSSRRLRASIRAAVSRAASRGSNRTGRSSASTAAARPACCPRTARSRLRAADFRSSPSCAPDSRIFTWADVEIDQSLRDGYLPIPSVRMASAALDADGDGVCHRRLAHDHNLSATYELRNLTDRPLALELVLAIRPSQVNPPTQFLNAPRRRRADQRHRLERPGTLTVERKRDGLPAARAEQRRARSTSTAGRS